MKDKYKFYIVECFSIGSPIFITFFISNVYGRACSLPFLNAAELFPNVIVRGVQCLVNFSRLIYECCPQFKPGLNFLFVNVKF